MSDAVAGLVELDDHPNTTPLIRRQIFVPPTSIVLVEELLPNKIPVLGTNVMEFVPSVTVLSFTFPEKSPAVPLPIAKEAAAVREMPVSVDHSKTAAEGSCTFELTPDPLCVKANVESPLTCVITGVPVVA